MTYDLLIHGGTIVTVDKDQRVIANGLVGVKDGRLACVRPHLASAPLPDAAETIDARGGLILPGLVNTHTHLPMTLFRGLADDLPLMTWLNEHIFPAEGAHINPETVKLGAQLACAEMLLSGTTCVCDGYFHEDDIAAAVAETGMRAVLAQGVIDFPAPGVPDPAQNVATARDFTARWRDRHPLITPSIFCHSPYTCSAATLEKAKQTARDAGVLFQIHAAETEFEKNQTLKEHGATPIGYLHRLGLLDEATLLVHAVWLTEQDIDLIAAAKSPVSHNPQSNMKLGAGIAPVPALLQAGITVSLGTDGCASNNNLDLFEEMDMAAKLHKIATEDPTVLDAETTLGLATRNGARALGLHQTTGSLAEGKAADLIIVSTRPAHMRPLYHPASHLVYTANGADVSDVVVAGKVVVRNRELLTLDLESLLQRATAMGKTIA